MTLEPGDIISTGSPAGIGVNRRPPLFLKHGDLMEVEIERLGCLRNPVSDPAAKFLSSASPPQNSI